MRKRSSKRFPAFRESQVVGLRQHCSCEWTFEGKPNAVSVSRGDVMLYVIRFQFESHFINEFAKGAFTCFLFHAACLPFMKIEQAVNSNLAVLFAHQILVSIVLYSISYVVYKIYSLCTGWFIKLIGPLCSKLDIR